MQINSTFTLGGQKLKNRLVVAPLTRARCTPNEASDNRLPNELMGLYYEQRASAGLIISEGTAPSAEGYGWRYAPGIYTQEQCDAWKPVLKRVHAKGGVMYCQLWHLGRQSHSTYHAKKRIVSASAIAVGPSGQATAADGTKQDYEVPHALTIEEIAETVQDFVKAAHFAKEAGFDGVEIHGANGYLIDQFFQQCTNKREDKYGGSMKNRARLVHEIFDAIVASGAFTSNRIGLRISPNGAFGGVGSQCNDELFPYIAASFEKKNMAYLHIMDGLAFGFHGKGAAVTLSDFRKVFSGVIISNCGLTKDVAEGIVRSGAADLACFGRLYISNPDLAERFANDWPIAPSAEYSTWWGPTGEKGYTDWPFYTPPAVKEEEKKPE